MLIVDASGSMKELLNGKETKMASAKSQIRKFLAQVPKDAEVGLVAYGNLLPGCDSARLYSPLKVGSGRDVANRLDTLIPAGSTPIARTIELVGKHLLSIKKKNTDIILVSDGLESCDGNPEEEIQKLKDAGYRFRFHILGLNIPKAGIPVLNDLATKGDGKFYSVEKPEEIQKAFADIYDWENPPVEMATNQVKEPEKRINTKPDLPISQIERLPSDETTPEKPWIQIHSIEKEKDDTYVLTYEYENFPKKRKHTVFVSLVDANSEKNKAVLSKREERTSGIKQVTSVDHETHEGSGKIKLTIRKKGKFSLRAELWETDAIPTPIAISEERSLEEAFFLKKNGI